MKKLTTLLASFAVAAVAALAPTIASAANLQWTFDNRVNGQINIIFFSQNRNHQWPGGNRYYYINPNDGVLAYNLDCRQGEKICYGAWFNSNSTYYWGVGQSGREGCTGCCYVCGAGTTDTINLNAN